MAELQEPGDTRGPCTSANVTLGGSLRTRSSAEDAFSVFLVSDPLGEDMKVTFN